MPNIPLNLSINLGDSEIQEHVQRRAREAVAHLLGEYFKTPVVTGNPAWDRRAGPGYDLIKEMTDAHLLSEPVRTMIEKTISDQVQERINEIVTDRLTRQVRKQVQQEFNARQEGNPK